MIENQGNSNRVQIQRSSFYKVDDVCRKNWCITIVCSFLAKLRKVNEHEKMCQPKKWRISTQFGNDKRQTPTEKNFGG